MDLSGLSGEQLWFRQVAVGGVLSCLDLEVYLAGLTRFDQHSHDVIAQALNEFFVDYYGATQHVVASTRGASYYPTADGTTTTSTQARVRGYDGPQQGRGPRPVTL